MLPDRVPLRIYAQVADQLGWPAALVRAISRKETWKADENPQWIRLETSRWKRYRMASREAQKFDKAKNSPVLKERWLRFVEMDEICKADAEVNPAARWAAVLSHSIGFGQILGDNHKFAGFNEPGAFWEANQTMEGQARSFVAFARSSERLMFLAKRLDLTPRVITLRARSHVLKLGDLSEISAIWNGPNYESNDYDRVLRVEFQFAQQEGFDGVRLA